jgi:hypothetical protein
MTSRGDGPYRSISPPMRDPAPADTRKKRDIAVETVALDQPNSDTIGSRIRVCPRMPMPEVIVRTTIPPKEIHHP